MYGVREHTASGTGCKQVVIFGIFEVQKESWSLTERMGEWPKAKGSWKMAEVSEKKCKQLEETDIYISYGRDEENSFNWTNLTLSNNFTNL